MDAEITGWINGFAGMSALADAVMVAVSAYGVQLVVGLVVLQWWGRRNRLHLRHAALAAGLSFLTGLALNQFVQLFVQRVRPYDSGVTGLLIAKSADWSFPSDHATAAVAVAVALLMQGLHLRGWLIMALAALICLSRVFIGVHYLGDVAGGAATGIVAALLVRSLYREGNAIDRIAVRIL